MVSANTDLMDLLAKKMSYLNKAVEVHAQNVANANTPGYKSLEVEPFSFGDALKQVSTTMMVTDPRHIVPASLADSNTTGVRVAKKAKSGDSDSQDMEQESMKVSQTGIEYQLVTSIYKKISSFFRLALKGS